jgi:hypothetical protein
MKKKFLILFVGFLVAHTTDAQTEYSFLPSATDAYITSPDYSHYAYIQPSVAPRQELLVFLGGTGSQPAQYKLFCREAALLGYHVLNLCYANSVSIQACANSADTDCFTNLRQEVIFGDDVSTSVSVSVPNAVINRLTKALQYLHTQHPTEGWNMFLDDGNQPIYAQIAFAGHSQGGGIGPFIARNHQVARCIMFASPNDYSNTSNLPANWCFEQHTTPVTRYYSFSHIQDEMGFFKQYAIWQALGMSDTLLSDGQLPPFGNSKSLTTNYVAATSKHNIVVVDASVPIVNEEPVFKTVWRYLLGDGGTSATTPQAYLPIQPTAYFDAYGNVCIDSYGYPISQGHAILHNLYGQRIDEWTGVSYNPWNNEHHITLLLSQSIPNGIYSLTYTLDKGKTYSSFIVKMSK